MPAPRRVVARLAAVLAAGVSACSAGGGAPVRSASPASLSPWNFSSFSAFPAPSASPGGDVPIYHGDQARSGDYAPAPPARGLSPAWHAVLDGAVYSQPLQVGSTTLAVTEHDSVYALGPTGRVRWHRQLGTPVPPSALPCGDIDPLGITGTPVYDPARGAVYLVAEEANPVRHVLYALSVRTGAVLLRRSVDRPGAEASVYQQRAALAVAGGRVWVAFGGLDGDCGPYVGYLAGVPLDGAGATAVYTVPTRREGGIWAPSGPAVDAAGDLFVAVGNGAATAGAWDGSDSVLKLHGTSVVSSFAPASWAAENAADEDLGSQGPLLVAGGRYVFAAGKSGVAYLLSAADLGGIGRPHATLPLCRSFGGAAAAGSSVYVPCTDGVRAVRVGAAGTLSLRWRAPAADDGSPVVGGGLVWVPDPGDGLVVGLDPASGAVRVSAAAGALPRFATPVLTGRLLLLGTLDGVRAWRTS